jgi:hypothetical protein
MITESEAQEMHEAIGATIESGDLEGLARAREIASIVARDVAAEKEEATPHREEEYRVVWEIDLTAPSPREAAEAAQAIQLRPNHATVFMVNGESIDLDEIEAEEED